MNGERRKHNASDCAWGSAIPEIKTTLDLLVKKIDADTKHRTEVDGEQYAILRTHTGEIGGLQSDVGHLGKRINNKVPAPVIPVSANCPEPTLWQAICKVKKVWFLFIFLGGGTVLTLFASLLQALATWLKTFASLTGGVP